MLLILLIAFILRYFPLLSKLSALRELFLFIYFSAFGVILVCPKSSEI